MKIIILDGYTENPGDLSWDGFSALGDLTVYDRTPPEDVAERIGDAQIVLTNKTPVTRETLKRCPEVRYIGVLATISWTSARPGSGASWCPISPPTAPQRWLSSCSR